MLRALSIGGMAGGFFMISPGLRGHVMQGYSTFVETLNDSSPWSYIAIGTLIFILLTIELYRHASPRGAGTPK